MTSSTQHPPKPSTARDEPAGEAGKSSLPQEPPQEADPIDEASAESFPASDPPAFTGTTATPSNEATPHDE